MKFVDYHNTILALEEQVQALYKYGPCSAEQIKEMDKLHARINGVLEETRAYTDSLVATSNQKEYNQLEDRVVRTALDSGTLNDDK